MTATDGNAGTRFGLQGLSGPPCRSAAPARVPTRRREGTDRVCGEPSGAGDIGDEEAAMRSETRRPLAVDILLGALAGAGGTWLMDKVTTAIYEHEGEAVQRRENAARGGRSAYEIAAQRLASLAGRSLGPGERKRLGAAIHWTLGTCAGGLYGLLRHRFPRLGRGSGLAYGAAFWAAADEGALTAFGLTPPPQAFPWQTHARGLIGHLVLGGAVEVVFDAADVAGR
jgi:hypothetical protein